MSRRLFNVFHVGVGFLLLYSTDYTTNNMLPSLYKGISNTNPEFNINGYIALAILYFVYGVALLTAPTVINLIGPRIGMILGSLAITSHVAVILTEKVPLIYTGMVLSGIGGSWIWVSEGNYLVLNSIPGSMGKDTSIFWALYTVSNIGGNVYAIIQLDHSSLDDQTTRQILLSVLSSIGILSTIVFLFLQKPQGIEENNDSIGKPFDAFVRTFNIIKTKEMLILIIFFIYMGLEQSFNSGIYSTCIGHLLAFGKRRTQLIPFSGLLFGIGNTLGGITVFFVCKKEFCKKRTIIGFGIILQILSSGLIYLNLPNESVFDITSKTSVIVPNAVLAIFCSFAMGIGECCLNTQIMPLLALLHPKYSIHTTALYKFTKSMFMALSFFCSSYLGLHVQLLLMVILALSAYIAFYFVDLRNDQKSS